MSGKQKSDLSYDEKAAQNDIYAIIDNMSREDVAMNHEEMVSDMATAEEAERRRNMTPHEWDAMEEAAANQLVRVAAAEAEEDPNMMKYRRQSAKETRALKAAKTRRDAKAREVMERRAEAEAAPREAERAAMARARRMADRMGAHEVVGELPAREKARLYSHPSGIRWKKTELKSKDPGGSSRDPGGSSRDPGSRYAMGRKLYKTRNKKSRRGRQGKRTRRARISRRTRRTRRARK
jgi:hypothetical protein